MEAFRRALAGDEGTVALVDIAGQQLRAVGIGAADHQGRYTADISSQASGAQIANVGSSRDQYLAAHMAAFLFGCELILEMHPADAGFDITLHDLEGIERAAEAGLGIGDNWCEPIDIAALAIEPFHVLDLIGALQRLVDAPRQRRAAIGRIEALIGIGLAGTVGIGRDLPAGEINCFQPGAHHLHRLAAGHGAERRDMILGIDQFPQTIGRMLGQRMPDLDRASEARYFISTVIAFNAVKAAFGRARDQFVECGIAHFPAPWFSRLWPRLRREDHMPAVSKILRMFRMSIDRRIVRWLRRNGRR